MRFIAPLLLPTLFLFISTHQSTGAPHCMVSLPPERCETTKQFKVIELPQDLLNMMVFGRSQSRFNVCGYFNAPHIFILKGLSRQQRERVVRHERGHEKCIHPRTVNILKSNQQWILR